MASMAQKFTYPRNINAVEIERDFGNVTFLLKVFDTYTIGKLFAKDGDELSLRVRHADGSVHQILTPVDLYPELGLMTFANIITVTSEY